MKKPSIQDLVQQTTERIRELDIAIHRATLHKKKELLSTLYDTRKNNYLLYRSLTGEVYPNATELLQ